MITRTGDGEEPSAQPERDLRHSGGDPWTGPRLRPNLRHQLERVRASTTVTRSGREPPPQRVSPDIPPALGEHDSEKKLEPYVKLLEEWLATTRTLKTQQDLTILHYSHGDLKLFANEVDVDALTAEDSRTKVVKHVRAF